MPVYVIGPDGKPHGPFGDPIEARDFGGSRWPGASEDRRENLNAWEIRITTKDAMVDPDLD